MVQQDETEDTFQVQDLFRRYSQDIWVFLYSLTKKQDIADDLTQEAFLRILNHRNEIDQLDSPKLWVFSIAKNVSRDYFRKAYVRRVLPSPDIENLSLGTVESEAISKVSIEHIWKIVTRLKRKYAEVILLRLKYDMSYGDIAYVLNENQNSVRVRYQRALELLRKALKGAGYDV